MSNAKKLNKKEIDSINKEQEKFAKKQKYTGNLKRIIAGVVATASITGATMFLASCSYESSVDNEVETGYMYLREDVVSNREREFEKSFAEYLSAKTGVDVKFVDIKTLEVVENNLILNGSVVRGDNKGEVEMSITLSLSQKQTENLLNSMTSVEYYGADGYGVFSFDNPNSFSLNYSSSLLDNLIETINNYSTSVKAIYNHEDKEFIYKADDLEKDM